MSTSVAAEVAADFKDALQDLTVNDRAQINNLMIIAKENTEHAQVISRELENHIRTVRPEWKLPALYVLDAIVKYVGTPYNIYLGRDLFRTFMDAYSLSAMSTRKAMDSLLQTWTQPPPESLETRPVFPPETTRSIETALIKYRTAALQRQQFETRSQKQIPNTLPGRPGPEPWRNTPTPPQHIAHRGVLPQQYGAPSATPPVTGPHVPPANYGWPVQPPPVDPVKLNSDINALIATTWTQYLADTTNTELQTKMKAFVDLRNILSSQQLPQAQLQAIQTQIRALGPPAESGPPQQFHAPIQPVPSPRPAMPAMAPTPIQPVPSPQPPVAAAAAPPSLAQLLQQYSTPPPATVAPTPPPPALAQLLKQSAAALPPQQVAPTPPPALAQLLQQSMAGPPRAAAPTPPPALAQLLQQAKAAPSAAAQSTNGSRSQDSKVELQTAAITKQSRPHLVSILYNTLSTQCTQCGRRFLKTEDGKRMKANHLDWHFKAKDPNLKSNLHRSLYLSEKDWISYREEDEASPVTNKPAATTTEQPKQRYLRVPSDAHLQNAPCPICQEKFDKQWLVEANDFVWMDAIKAGGRIYHQSCFGEVMRRSESPESVLGKRKAQEEMKRTKIKV